MTEQMSEGHDSFFKRRWKLLLNIVTITALIILIVAIHKQLTETLKTLPHINYWVVLLIIPIEVLNYHAQAAMYQRMFKVVGTKLSYKYLYRLAVELNFINHVFPSGGVSGISYFGLRLRGQGVRVSKSTLVHTMKLVLVFLSFEILIIAGMLALAIKGHSNNLMILIGSSLSTLLIVGTALFFYLAGSKSRIDAFFTMVTRVLNRLIQVVRPGHPETINIAAARQAFNEFHEDYLQLRSRWKELQQPFWYGLLANVTEVAAVYVVYVAFGDFVNIGAVILAYAIANFGGLVSVLPGGVGIYEALMTAVLVAAGVPAALSIPVTVMYRVISILVQVPPGYILYHQSLRRGAPPVERATVNGAD